QFPIRVNAWHTRVDVAVISAHVYYRAIAAQCCGACEQQLNASLRRSVRIIEPADVTAFIIDRDADALPRQQSDRLGQTVITKERADGESREGGGQCGRPEVEDPGKPGVRGRSEVTQPIGRRGCELIKGNKLERVGGFRRHGCLSQKKRAADEKKTCAQTQW